MKMSQLAYHSIQPILQDYHNGKIDEIEARYEIVDLVRNMTYKDQYGNNYIFMSSYEGTMLVQPFEPQKEGTNQWNLRDSNGKYIIRELVQAAKANPEGAFVSYYYFVPKINRVEEKLSYVIGIPEIDAYIGTGMYLDSSYKELAKILKWQGYGFVLMIAFLIGAITIYVRALLKTNRKLSNEIKEREYAESNIRTVFDTIHDSVIIHDNNGRIKLANKRASELYQIPEERMTSYTIRELSSSEPQDILNQTNDLENSSLVFEWKARRPMDHSDFDCEVALRKTQWSGENMIVAVIRDITERKKQEKEIQHLAYNDYLTSLPNRVFIMKELKKELENKEKGTANGAIIFVDLDNFKKINDTFGHFFGDEVLIQLSKRLRKLEPAKYLPARIGGDEFVILCYESDRNQAAAVAEKILEYFRDSISLHENLVNITCSMGIAVYPEDGNTVQEIFKNADMALYSAKDQGKDNYVFYNQEMSADMQYKTEMEGKLRNAFDDNELLLYFQPVFDSVNYEIVGCEALLRWNSGQYGIVSPNRIIPLAEEIGLIDKIGDWVIESTFAFAESLQTDLQRDIYVSCNVSPVQLAHSHFVERVLKLFERYHLKKGSVAFEITESCFIDSFNDAAGKLFRLREKGIIILLDDFGTGYSSLNYLKNLPVDYIKIDKSFIDNIEFSGAEKRILKTIITLAHDLGIKTVAEGVESKEQLDYLKLSECDFIQGFLFSRPKPEVEIRKELTILR